MTVLSHHYAGEEGLGLESRGEKGLANTTERCSVGEKE